ncbi:hypothetical protein SCYAM73S_04252 [Streptomyces cyaneofuscatus]
MVLQDGAPADGGLVGVGGPYDVEAGDRAESGELFDRLVGGAVLAEADGVVGPDVGDRQLHQGGEADGRAHVVAEDQERTAVGAGEALERDAVEDGTHGVLADAEVERAAVGVSGEFTGLLPLGHEGRLALHGGVVAAREVGRAAPQLGEHGCQRGQDVAGGLAGGDALGVGVEDGQAVGPAVGELLLQQPVQERGALGVGGAPLLVAGLPGAVGLGAPFPYRTGVFQYVVLDGEVGVRVEAEQLLGGGDLVVAEGGTMGLAGVLLGGRGPADDRPQQDQGRAAGLALRGLDGGEQGVDVLHVVAGAGEVDRLDVPAVRGVAGGHVLAEGDVGVVLDGDVVGVVEDDEVAELLASGQRTGLGRDAFHQVAVGGDDVHVVVEGAGAGRRVGVEEAALAAGGHGHADGGGEPLAERPGGDLDAPGVAVLGVAGGAGAPGSQRLQVVQLHAVTAQVQLDVEGEAGVAAGEHEAVAAEPLVVGRVVAHDLLEEQVREGRQAHRGAGVAVARLLHGVGGEQPDGVDGADVERAPARRVRDRQGQLRVAAAVRALRRFGGVGGCHQVLLVGGAGGERRTCGPRPRAARLLGRVPPETASKHGHSHAKGGGRQEDRTPL